MWKNVIFLNNFLSDAKQDWCLPHTWYLDVDFQLFVFSPLVMVPMWWVANKKSDGSKKGRMIALGIAAAIVAIFTIVLISLDAVADYPLTARYVQENIIRLVKGLTEFVAVLWSTAAFTLLTTG